jgi:hypothetical protein
MSTGNRPAEIFGYPSENHSELAAQTRDKHWCQFVDKKCNKRSRLLDYPFGVCSVFHHGKICTTCPRRFEEPGKIGNVPRVLEDVAIHYFGDLNNVVPFAEVNLPGVGHIDYVLVRHKPMQVEVEDFVAVEFQTDSTTGTGQIVQGLRDHMNGEDIAGQSYKFGMNTYDTIKRAITQLLNKGIVYEAWKDVKCYWIIQEYIYTNLVKRYGMKTNGYDQGHASRFALYDLVLDNARFTLSKPRYISTTVDDVYRAMHDNPGLPNKDKFVETLNKKLKMRLSIKLD